ncbi:hypothetical protein [Tabrizicola sp.]|uniref:hypothetical protein n=1 Tax=Tabrizicola sp. TaxID=2005166 RepID=UPI0035B16072
MTSDRKRILLNDLALHLMPDAIAPDDQRVTVAGNSLVRMTLAELALPEARMIWTDFRHSASLAALQAALRAEGGLDRLVLAADGEEGEQAFSVMCAVLSLLPVLHRRSGGRIELICTAGGAVASLVAFVERIGPRLARDGVAVTLAILEPRKDHAAA